jgi:tRNA (guanosine-2'-O-)-methyltransferase
MSDASKPGKTIRSKTGVRKLHRELFPDRAREMELAFMLQDWDDPYNVGGMFRVADACGAKELVLTGKTPEPPHPQIHVTSLGHHRRVPWRTIARYDDACRTLKEEGYTLVAVEIADNANHYMEYAYPQKLCLVLGNEVNGVYPSVMRQIDAAVVIPMAGKGRSLNVHVAAAVVAFEALLGSRSG